MADVWLPIRPGSEEALALGLAGALSAAEAAAATGLTEAQIPSLAAELSANGPSLVVDRGMSAAVVALNVKLGAWGRTIGPRREAPVPQEWKKAAPRTDLSAVADRSVRVLLIDESTPGQYVAWEEIEKKAGRRESRGGGVFAVRRRTRTLCEVCACRRRFTRSQWMIFRRRWIRWRRASGSPPRWCRPLPV